MPSPLKRLLGISPFTPLRLRIDRWIQQRLPRTNHWVLSQRNLYVLPTRAGWMLGLTATLLLIAAINYQINLGFLFTFMLAGVTFISILVAHSNLRGLELNTHEPPPVFAASPAVLTVYLQHTSANTKFAIGLAPQLPVTAAPLASPPLLVDAQKEQPTTAQVLLPMPVRGRHDCPTISVETRYPIGAFRVWSLWRPNVQLWVYPAPEPNAPSIAQSGLAGDAGVASSRSPSFEMEGFRTYQRGDPLKSILWKKTATAIATGSGDWIRRDQTQLDTTQVWLDHAATGLQQPEAVLSRLCAWILMADAQGLTYGLRLPHQKIEPANGPNHKHQCLKALALS
ncbi:DUF58 domain-containing protein [Lampropedia puyangensis]|uniref:DUF58 domain-containing protein n=1 Tax=Lampropedia puyangensis TaxID=1330072 RepID=A0A4V4GQP5_9BURK|nr:DUF58 domain-containing protein [Lampropedia puyangensis]THT98655.1 DUF58 domain-containing protein [Lampropedia puyangensis]